MELRASLIYKTHTSHLPTTLPVRYYGLPNGKVLIIYSRFYEIDFNHSELEFVFAIQKEFYFDFKNNILFLCEKSKKLFPVVFEMVDKPEPKIRILKVLRKLKSYSEAESFLSTLFLNSDNFHFKKLNKTNSELRHLLAD